MKISMIGAGYVGLTSGAVFASLGNTVWVVRRDSEKIEKLKKGIIPIYEPGLSEIVKRNVKSGRLIPTTQYCECVPFSDVVFIAVGTPEGRDGADLSQVYAAAEEIARNLKKGFTVIVDKSTVPPGTAEEVTEIINKHKRAGARFEVASSPEFLRQGNAVEDTTKPDRVVIGVSSSKAANILVKLHKDLKCPVVITKVRSAEIIKLAANAYLSLRIGFIDQISDLCEKMGADVQDIIQGIGLDRRIGTHYWWPGMGYGGYCFPKDVKALAALYKASGQKNNLFSKLDELNEKRVERFALRISEKIGTLKGKQIGVLGLSSRPDTDDIRGSVPLNFIRILLRFGAKVKAYDPMAQENAKVIMGSDVEFLNNPYDVAKNADALCVVTEWKEFKKLDLKNIKKLMKGKVLLDSKDIYTPEKIKKLGFTYLSTGRT